MSIKLKKPVKWEERQPRRDWITEYISIGSSPSFFSVNNYNEKDQFKLKNALSQTYLLTNKSRPQKINKESLLIGSILSKIFQRGSIPYCTISIEEEIKKQLDDLLIKDENLIKKEISRSGIYELALKIVSKRKKIYTR